VGERVCSGLFIWHWDFYVCGWSIWRHWNALHAWQEFARPREIEAMDQPLHYFTAREDWEVGIEQVQNTWMFGPGDAR
jgi:hypothetical protein